MEREKLIDVALGKEPADLVIRGKLVNVYTGEIYKTNVAIKGKRIAYVGNERHTEGTNTQIIDVSDKYLLPGFIDTHIHSGVPQLTMTRMAEALLSNGTTSIATDLYDVGVIAGVEGIRFVLNEAKETGLNLLFVIPVLAYEQHNPFGNTNRISETELFEMLNWPETAGVNEPPTQWMVDERRSTMLKLVDEAIKKGKVFVGHASVTTGRRLNSYISLGAGSDHECLDAEEAVEKLRLGMQIMMREGSAAVDLANLVKAITERNMPSEHFMVCVDDLDPKDLYNQGHINFALRKAIGQGLNPIKAIQIATINAARYFRKDHDIGSIAPGRLADIIVTNELTELNINYVFSKGQLVVKDGSFLQPYPEVKYPEYMKSKINLKKTVELKDLAITTDRSGLVKVRVIHCSDGTLLTERSEAELPVKNGEIHPDAAIDIAKMVVIERHSASGQIGKAFVSGFGLKRGAFAQTYNPVTDNLVALGTSDQDILVAVNKVQSMGGGIAVVDNGEVIEAHKLSILGVMSEQPIAVVAESYNRVLNAIRKLGCNYNAAVVTLGFAAMAYGIPIYRLSEYGLVDIEEGKLVDLIIDSPFVETKR